MNTNILSIGDIGSGDNAAKLVESLLNLGPIALLALLLLAGSYMIRASKFSNRWIPWIVAAAGPLLLEGLFPIKDLVGKWEHPRFVIGIYGFIVAVVVWAVHEYLLSKIEDWLAAKGFFPKALQRESSQTPPAPPAS